MATVQKRGETYRITVSAGYDSTGKQVRRSTTWKPAPGMTAKQTEKELERQKVLFEEKVRTGQYMEGNIKFQDFAERWFKDYAADHLRAGTYEKYAMLSVRTYQAIGHIRLDRLQPHHLIAFYQQLSQDGVRGELRYKPAVPMKEMIKGQGVTQLSFAEACGVSTAVVKKIVAGDTISPKSAAKIAARLNKGVTELFTAVRAQGKLSPKTIKHYHTFISSVMERAVKWQLIQDNPCRRIDPPKVPHHEIQCMNREEATRFLECLSNEPIQDQALFSLLLYTGLRRGEALGLEWGDVDFDSGVLSVRRTLQYTAKKGLYEDTTKTEQSKRSIRITAHMLELLRSHRAEQSAQRLRIGDRWQGSKKIFTNTSGGDMSVNIPYHHLKTIQEKYDLPRVSLHSLRHTSASLLIGQGIDVRAVSGRLGHSQTSTTMNIYAHQLQDADAAAAEALDFALKKA